MRHSQARCLKTTDHLTPNSKLFNIRKKIQLLASSSQSENIWKKRKKRVTN